jgi:hypothetical protein
MEKNVYFSRGTLRANRVHFAICPGGHIRLKPGNLCNGSIVVDGQFTGEKARIDLFRVERETMVKVGPDYEPYKKSAIIDVVNHKLLSMPSNLDLFASEMARRAVMAANALE